MLKLALAALVAFALAALVAFLPLRGRTVLARWRAATGPVELVERGTLELKAAWSGAPEGSRRGGSTPAQPARPAGSRPEALPAEQHSAQDREAVDRLVAEHARER